jgi:hypothetical protein
MGTHTDTPLLTPVNHPNQRRRNLPRPSRDHLSLDENLPTLYQALHRDRADLYQLSNGVLETLMAILNNPKSSPAMFILQRPQLTKTGWTTPEPAPNPRRERFSKRSRRADSCRGINNFRTRIARRRGDRMQRNATRN